jgi:SAM-dependent methyltransferase
LPAGFEPSGEFNFMLHFFHRIRNALRKGRANFYADVRLSEDDVIKETYKEYLGGGKENWESRGEFQLYFLKKMGLMPECRLLDVGCGPLRAGVHFIRYLGPGHYAGFDYNFDFVETALRVVADDPALSEKRPFLARVNDFDFSLVEGKFDYVMAFSVLNHCDEEKKNLFFQRLPAILQPTGKVYVTHARWLQTFSTPGDKLKVARTLRGPRDIAADLDMQTWGWPPHESIYPILELMLSNAQPCEGPCVI